MRVAALQTPDHRFDLLPAQLDKQPKTATPLAHAEHLGDSPALALLLAGGALCNDATLNPDAAPDTIAGEPTECALLDAAQQFDISKTELETIMPRVAELPFDATRKRMTTLHHTPSSAHSLTPLPTHTSGRSPKSHCCQ
jgi:Ca2+-transporting ATPase